MSNLIRFCSRAVIRPVGLLELLADVGGAGEGAAAGVAVEGVALASTQLANMSLRDSKYLEAGKVMKWVTVAPSQLCCPVL